MKSLRLFIEREFKTRVGKKGYWVFTLIGLAVMVALAFLPNIMNWIDEQTTTRVALYDPKGLVAEQIVHTQSGVTSGSQPFQFLIATSADVGTAATADAKAYLSHVDAKALVVVQGNAASGASFVIYQAKSIDPTEMTVLKNLIQEQVLQARIQSLDSGSRAVLTQPVQFVAQQLDSNALPMQQMIESKMLVYCMEILLLVTLVIYGTRVAQGVIEEKSNRVIELLMVAGKPWQILFGKVLGVGLAAILQYAIWVGAILLALSVSHSLDAVSLNSVSWQTILFFPVFFILGYILYASLFSIGGSLVYRAEEQQMAITPVSMLMVLSFYAGMIALANPDSTFALIVSLIPLSAPVAMFARVALSPVPVWQLTLSIVLLLAVIWLSVSTGERIYRKHVLHTSGSAGWKLLFRRDRAATVSSGK